MSFYYDFDTEAKKYQVNQFPLDKISEYENGVCKKDKNWGRFKKCLIMTEIYSLRTAHLLNYIFNTMRDEANIWRNGFGGGIIIDSGTQVIIGKFNEIGLKMSIRHNDKVTNSIIFKPTVFRKIRSNIKTFIRLNFEDRHVKSIRNVKDNDYIIGTVTLNELNLLMDFFGYKKIEQKYSKTLIEKMIGQKTNDQFLISATEVFLMEVDAMTQEKLVKIEELNKRYTNIKDWISKKFQKAIDEIETDFQIKMNNIQAQILELNKN